MSFNASAVQNSHLNDFANIFEKYCFAFKDNHKKAGELLEREGHSRNPEFQDAYEIIIGSIDYAVTPQSYDCTADVLVKHDGKSLFTHAELSTYLVSEFSLVESAKSTFEDVALNNENTKIRQTDYTDPSGSTYRLLFPLDNQESYYMTFTVDW